MCKGSGTVEENNTHSQEGRRRRQACADHHWRYVKYRLRASNKQTKELKNSTPFALVVFQGNINELAVLDSTGRPSGSGSLQ